MSVRMLMFSTVDPEREREFERSFSSVRRRVTQVAGHLRDELLREDGVPGSYLLVSEWRSRDEFVRWLHSPSHQEMTGPLHQYFTGASRLRYYAAALPEAGETGGPQGCR